MVVKKIHIDFRFSILIKEDFHDFKLLFDSIKKSVRKYSPTTLIPDNASVIKNGFTVSFGLSIKPVNCWAHAIHTIDIELSKVNADHRNSMRRDIFEVQLQSNPLKVNSLNVNILLK